MSSTSPSRRASRSQKRPLQQAGSSPSRSGVERLGVRSPCRFLGILAGVCQVWLLVESENPLESPQGEEPAGAISGKIRHWWANFSQRDAHFRNAILRKGFTMTTLELVFIYSAAIGGVFFLVQFLMSFIGGDGDELGDAGSTDGGFDFDLDGGDSAGHGHSVSSLFFEVLSLRTIAAGVTFFGLVGIAAAKSGANPTQAVSLGALAGVASLYGMYWLYKQLWRLQSSGNEDIRNSLGLPAQVYVPIPAGSNGRGKVQLVMQGRISEYQAMTEDDQPLKTGEPVVVVDIINSDTLLVSRDRKPEASLAASV